MAQQVIVCDDEPHIVRAISLKLTRAGFDVKGTANVESGWQLLNRSHDPALLIVDDSMPPGPTGIELVRRVRNHSQFVSLPVIILTAQGVNRDDEEELLDVLNVSQIIKKPFSPRELLETINRILDPAKVLVSR